MSKATEQVYKEKKYWGIAYYTTEFGPLLAGIITAMVINPSVWTYLIYVLFGVIILGTIVLIYSKNWKTLLWGIILVLVLALQSWVTYVVVGTCFLFAAANDLWIGPKYEKLKNTYEQYKNQDAYEERNK